MLFLCLTNVSWLAIKIIQKSGSLVAALGNKGRLLE